MNTTTTLNGSTLLVRIGYARRTNTPYYPPVSIMEEYLRFSQTHDNKVLYPIGAFGVSETDIADHLILWSQKTPKKLIAEIHEIGKPYSPNLWNPNDPYQAPEPWNMLPAFRWIKLDNLQPLDTFDPEQYEAKHKTEIIPLTEALEVMKRQPVIRIQPKGTAATLPNG